MGNICQRKANTKTDRTSYWEKPYLGQSIFKNQTFFFLQKQVSQASKDSGHC